MGKRGPKPGSNPRYRISEEWSPELAYAVGLLATDGYVAGTQPLVDLTSKDKEQLLNFSRCLNRTFTIGTKYSGSRQVRSVSFRVQFKSIPFHKFLLSIGLTPAKSRTLGPLKIPKEYFWDFLRGVYDGDGSSHAYWDPRWKSSYMFYTIFASASKKYIDWLQDEIHTRIGRRGHITSARKKHIVYQLKFAKSDSLLLLRKMYHKKEIMCLSRKRLKIEKILSIIGQKL